MRSAALLNCSQIGNQSAGSSSLCASLGLCATALADCCALAGRGPCACYRRSQVSPTARDVRATGGYHVPRWSRPGRSFSVLPAQFRPVSCQRAVPVMEDRSLIGRAILTLSAHPSTKPYRFLADRAGCMYLCYSHMTANLAALPLPPIHAGLELDVAGYIPSASPFHVSAIAVGGSMHYVCARAQN